MICSLCRNVLEEKVLDDGSSEIVAKYKSYNPNLTCPKCQGDLAAVIKEREAILYFTLEALAETSKFPSSAEGIVVKAWNSLKELLFCEEVYES